MDSRSLIPRKEKQFVFEDRPANCPAELVTLDGISSHREGIPRVENSIPDKFKHIAMKIIRTGFCNEADRTRGFADGCGRCSAGLDFELLQRIRERRGHIPIPLGVHVKRSVQRETHSCVQTTGN